MKSIQIDEDVRVKFSITGEMNIHKALLHLTNEGFQPKVKRYDNEAYITAIAHPGTMTRLYDIYRHYSK